jgi:hypothetical protein
MSARKTNTTIIIFGGLAFVLLGAFMFFLADKPIFKSIAKLTETFCEKSGLDTDETGISITTRGRRQKGLTITYIAPTGMPAAPESVRKEEARRLAFILFEEARALNARIEKEKRKARFSTSTTSPHTARSAPSTSGQRIGVFFITVTMQSRSGVFGCSRTDVHSYTFEQREYREHLNKQKRLARKKRKEGKKKP